MVEPTVLDYRSNIGLPQPVSEGVPVVALVGDDGLQLAEIPSQHLPANLSVVRLLHREVNVEEAVVA